jgi:hypothetical protein
MSKDPSRIRRPSAEYPWHYHDIPRPPLGIGIEVISAPEAVGILGAKTLPMLGEMPGFCSGQEGC